MCKAILCMYSYQSPASRFGVHIYNRVLRVLCKETAPLRIGSRRFNELHRGISPMTSRRQFRRSACSPPRCTCLPHSPSRRRAPTAATILPISSRARSTASGSAKPPRAPSIWRTRTPGKSRSAVRARISAISCSPRPTASRSAAYLDLVASAAAVVFTLPKDDMLKGATRCVKRTGLIHGDDVSIRYRRLDMRCTRTKTEVLDHDLPQPGAVGQAGGTLCSPWGGIGSDRAHLNDRIHKALGSPRHDRVDRTRIFPVSVSAIAPSAPPIVPLTSAPKTADPTVDASAGDAGEAQPTPPPPLPPGQGTRVDQLV